MVILLASVYLYFVFTENVVFHRSVLIVDVLFYAFSLFWLILPENQTIPLNSFRPVSAVIINLLF